MPDVPGHLEPPLGSARGHAPGGGQRDELVPGSVQVEDGEIEGVEPGHGGPGAGHGPRERPGRGQVGTVAGGPVDLLGEGDVGVHHLGGDPGRVDAGGAQHPAHGLFGRGPVPAGGQVPLPHPGDRAEHEVREDPRVDHAQALGGQRGVDQDEAGHALGDRRGAQGGDQSPERVAEEDDRAVRDPGDEPGEQVHVTVDARRPPRGGGTPVAQEVEGHQPAAGDQVGSDRGPVEMGATEAVDADQQRGTLGAAVVDVVDRATDIDGPGHVGDSCQGRHPTEATGPSVGTGSGSPGATGPPVSRAGSRAAGR